MPISYAESISRELNSQLCEQLGFKKKYGVLWKELSSVATGFLGIGGVTYRSNYLVDVTVTVGIRFTHPYNLAIELGGSPDNKAGCSLAENLRYLLPEVNEYSFRKGENSSEVVERLISDVNNYALPFYAAYSSVESAVRSLESSSERPRGTHIFLPVAYLDMGLFSQAIEAAEKFATQFDARRSTGIHYNEFVSKLRFCADLRSKLA